MNQMESATPVHKWAERLRPGDLIRVSYGSSSHYWDLPNSFHHSNQEDWLTKRLEEENLPVSSYIYGYSVKDRIHPTQEWMLTKPQKKYYKKLLKFLK